VNSALVAGMKRQFFSSPVEVNTYSIDVRHNTDNAAIVRKRAIIFDNVRRSKNQQKVLEVTDIETDPEIMVAGEIVLVREDSRIKMSSKCSQKTKSMI
jgi:deoxycytidine triphosphate deaminase